MEYTKEQVIEELAVLISVKTRKQIVVDKKSYLIGILAFKFKISEHKISQLTGIARNTVNYQKNLVLKLYNDKTYQINNKENIELFPFDFSIVKPYTKPNINRKEKVILTLEPQVVKKLKSIGKLHNHKRIKSTIYFILENLKLWEE